MFSSIVKVFFIVVVLFLGFVVFVYVGEAFANMFPNTIFTKWWRNNIVGRLPNNDIFF